MNNNFNLSHFESISDKNPSIIQINDFFNSIKTGIVNKKSIIPIIEKIRKTEDINEKKTLKQSLPAVTVSSICQNGHKKENITSRTGLLQIDIDKIEDLDFQIQLLINDPNIYTLYISAGGKGLKCFIKTGDRDHKTIFFEAETYFIDKYGITIDKQVKDESRLCFYSFDPRIYINESAIIFEPGIFKKTSEKIHSVQDVNYVITQIEQYKKDITTSYKFWLDIGFALTESFGAEGEVYFHRISRFNQEYNFQKCHDQYINCLNSSGDGITIKTFFHIAKENGIEIINNSDSSSFGDNTDKNSTNFIEFCNPILDKDGNVKDLIIDYTKWIDILYQLGFIRFDIDKDFVFVHKKDQVLEQVSVFKIQDKFLEYLDNLPEKINKIVTRDFIKRKFYKSPGHYFCENRLNLLRPKENIKFNSDSKDECFIYFKNGFVRITKEGYVLKNYSELTGHIWKDQIVNRDFKYINQANRSFNEIGEFARFVYNICGKNDKRWFSLCTIIGYLLHSFYSCKLKAVVFTDSKISDSPSGRTGKTFFCQALGHIKKYTEINGKDFNAENKHKYQQAELDTQIIHLNDVKKNFDFESLFNDITEGVVIDKKNAKPFRIKSKLVLSTNQTIKIEGASAKDRAIEFEFSDYYSDKYSPENEFKHRLFDEWDEKEWLEYFNFCMFCITLYLDKGLTEAEPVNLNRRKALETTSSEFVEFVETQIQDEEIKNATEYEKKVLFETFLNEYSEYKDSKYFTLKKFTLWLRTYSKYSEFIHPIDPDKDERKSGANRFVKFNFKI